MKNEFRDGIALRYTWDVKITPAISGIRNYDTTKIREVFTKLMDVICQDVQIERKLQSPDGETLSSNSTTTDNDARLNIKTNGLWGSRFNRIFFDVNIFKPHAKREELP